MTVVRDLHARTVDLDPRDTGPMSVRELATTAALTLGLNPDGVYTLATPDGTEVLDVEAIAPTSGLYDLVEVGDAIRDDA